MEAAAKVCRQYHAQEKANPEPSRRLYIARERSYHGATLGALDISGHYDRKDIHDHILPKNSRFVPPCNPYRDMKVGETEQQYVARLAEVLDRKIRELGPNNVAGFFAEPIVGAVSTDKATLIGLGVQWRYIVVAIFLSTPFKVLNSGYTCINSIYRHWAACLHFLDTSQR